jgi:hypothetical protein
MIESSHENSPMETLLPTPVSYGRTLIDKLVSELIKPNAPFVKIERLFEREILVVFRIPNWDSEGGSESARKPGLPVQGALRQMILSRTGSTCCCAHSTTSSS